MFNRKYVNINALDNCMTIMNQHYENGSPLVLSTCTGSTDQKFIYNPATHEIKYNNKCLKINNQNDNTPIELWSCDNSDSQKWIYDNNTFQFKNMKNVNKCMDVAHSSIKNGTPIQLQTCVNIDSQKFQIVNATDKPRIPLVLRSNITIPLGSLPLIQLAKINPYRVLFFNDKNENILVNPGTTLTNESEKLIYLNKNHLPFEKIIVKFILGPLSILRITYRENNQTQSMLFANGTTEYDLIYDQSCFNLSMKNKLSKVVSYDINSNSTFKISRTFQIDFNIYTGHLLVANADAEYNINNFTPITNKKYITKTEKYNYILGAYTLIILGNFIFYNATAKPIYYQNLEGIEYSGNIKIYSGAPLYCGYAKLTDNCHLNGLLLTCLVGKYNSYNKINTASIQNPEWNELTYYSVEQSKNPFVVFPSKKVNMVILGPFTKITLYYGADFSGNPRIYENNSYNEVSYNLCDDNYKNVADSFIISLSSGYTGFGIITTKTENIQINKTLIEGYSIDQKNPNIMLMYVLLIALVLTIFFVVML